MGAETPAPTTMWALLRHDPAIGEQRIVGIYSRPEDASTDAIQLDTGTAWIEVQPYFIHNAPRWSSHHEPVTEETDGDFDVVVEETTG